MRTILRKCNICKKYTMREMCCGEETISPAPPRYSPEDRYGEYRRRLKRMVS